jgi:hypothetical protein
LSWNKLRRLRFRLEGRLPALFSCQKVLYECITKRAGKSIKS